MTDDAVPYPSSPSNVPPDFTAPTTSYRVRVVIVLISLFLFVCLYIGLVARSAYLCYKPFSSLIPSEPKNITEQKILQDTLRTDEQLTKLYNDALQQRQEGKITDAALAGTLERDLLPPWQAQRQKLATASGLPRAEQQLVDLLGKSFELQEEKWLQLAKDLRDNDAKMALQSQQQAQEFGKIVRNKDFIQSHKFWSQQQSRESGQVAREISAAKIYQRSSSVKDDPDGLLTGIFSGLFCLFLVKGFFKWRREDTTQRLEITEKDQPVLFAFIRQVCRDTGAPLPYRVYLTPEVNAAVFYHESLLNLFLPTPKNLIIGLGLVNQVNLSEFKSILAHEFGHFSQNSMKIGTYVYISNRIIGDLVFGRDWLDDLIAALVRIDFRAAIFVWPFAGLLWVVRKAFQGLFRLINFANSALSRQMEFNADLVAVSTTGSDALINGISRLDFANEALGQAWADLNVAADHQLYSRDLLYHQTCAANYLRALRKNPHLGEPPALPEDPREIVQVFPPEDTSVPRMWATHPSNHDREVNAKSYYIRCPIDQRSPWILFHEPEAVREKITRQIYQQARKLREVNLVAPELVQCFIDEEHAETTYHPRYHGLYDNRYIKPGDLKELLCFPPAEADKVADAYGRLYGDDLKARMDAHEGRQKEYQLIAQLAQGTGEVRSKDFHFRGLSYQHREAKRLLEQVNKEIEQDFDWMANLDRDAFLTHYNMARQVSEETQRDMEDRYRFHLAVQNIHNHLSFHNQQARDTLNQLAGKPELNQEEFHGTIEVLRQAHNALRQMLEAADQLFLPGLKNMKKGESLGQFLLNRLMVEELDSDSNSLDGGWISSFLDQLAEVLDKAKRIHFKSLGGILALQEKLAEQWKVLVSCNAQATKVEAEPAVSTDRAGLTA